MVQSRIRSGHTEFDPVADIYLQCHHTEMRIHLRIAILLMLTGMRGHALDPATVTTGNENVGRWVPFYHLDFGEDRLDYFYDGDSIVPDGHHVIARWKVVGKIPATTTLTVIEVGCDTLTFTERATILINASGNRRVLPSNELFAGHAIESGKSADVFARIACR
ncbi:MAG: hypothetical protein V4530_06995 [Pseudomonadota bacterium]